MSRSAGVGAQPPMSPADIRAASSIEDLMPDEDRREVALSALGAVVDHADEWLSRNRETTLTEAEIKVLRAASAGLTGVETAEEYGKSVFTVNRQLATARSRLGAKTTAQAVAIALREGLIE